jgi:hypothetical protein
MRGVLLLCCAVLTSAVEGGQAEVDRDPPPKPGHDAPVSAAEPCVLRFDWDGYSTVIVVGEGVGMVKPAWVTTFKGGEFHVGYRATAFRDTRGRLQVDARHSSDVGPQADNWIPDSFAFGSTLLWTLDDQGSGHVATMGERILAAADRPAWHKELQRVLALIEGGL